MKLNKSTQDAYGFLKRLYEAGEESDSPNFLMRYNQLQVYGAIEETDKYHWFPEATESQVDQYISHLYLFGSDGGGGEFLLWSYPGINKEPSAVFISSEVGMSYLAPSLSDYVLNLPYNTIDFESDSPFRKTLYPSLSERLSTLDTKLAESNSAFFDLTLDSVNSRYDDYSELIYDLEDQDEFWLHTWPLSSLSEIHQEFHDDFKVTITLRETIQRVAEWMRKTSSEAQRSFQPSPEDDALREKKYFNEMVGEIYEID